MAEVLTFPPRPAQPSTSASSFRVPRRRPWLDGVIYDEPGRAHTFNRAPILSVTQILSIAGKTDFSKINAEVVQRKGRIGTAAHLASHFYDEGDLVDASIDPQVAPYFEAWKSFRAQRNFVPEVLETIVFSREYGFVGKTDRVGLVDRRTRTIIDICCGDEGDARKDLQTIGYEIALMEEFPEFFAIANVPRWSVQLFNTGRYRVTKYPKSPRTWQHDKGEFLEALNDARIVTGTNWRGERMTTKTLFDVHVTGASEPDEPPPPMHVPDDGPPPPAAAGDDVPPGPASDDEPPPPALMTNDNVIVPDVLPAVPIPATIVDPGDKSLVESLLKANQAIVVHARGLAASVKDKPTAQAAVDYAKQLDAEIKDAIAKIDGPKRRARIPYQDWLDIEAAIVGPREEAKQILTGTTGAVTKWIAEQKRLAAKKAAEEQAARDRDAAEKRAAAERERLKAEEDARKARQAGDAQAAAEAARRAAEAEHTRDTTHAGVADIDTSATQLAGATGRKRMDWEFTEEEPKAMQKFLAGIARPTVLKEIIESIKAVDGWESSTAIEIVNFIDHHADTAVDIPIKAVTLNKKYLGSRARDDGDTLQWPGIRFFDAGSTALTNRKTS